MNKITTHLPVKAQDGYSLYQAQYGRRRMGQGAHGYRLPEEVNHGPAAILDLSPAANDLMLYLHDRAS